MLTLPPPGGARFLPREGDAWQGAGGAALLQAALMHREQQRMAAHHSHPPTHPQSMPAETPGSRLLEALAQRTGGTAAPY